MVLNFKWEGLVAFLKCMHIQRDIFFKKGIYLVTILEGDSCGTHPFLIHF